ncbi:hypothetical protein N7494_011137 [Penicillium frequentans]|uniref:Uncharacterized protein n=1 Tax=Penicillium frequentans TaxID=3151616 RepID=A0AAD6CJ38_9EURO|nr:hypothetical protein N7494_011137 [Penicillium glabrum]
MPPPAVTQAALWKRNELVAYVSGSSVPISNFKEPWAYLAWVAMMMVFEVTQPAGQGEFESC